MRLRAHWRVASKKPQRSREALILLDTMGPLTGSPSVLLLRARAASQAGFVRGATSALFELLSTVRGLPGGSPLARRALAILETLPESNSSAGQLSVLKRALREVARGPAAAGS